MSRQLFQKPHYILLCCVEPGGALILNQTYYGRVSSRQGNYETLLEVWVDGELRILEDRRFVPLRRDNWWMFSRAQRDRFRIPPQWDRRFWNPAVKRRAA